MAESVEDEQAVLDACLRVLVNTPPQPKKSADRVQEELDTGGEEDAD